jgi:aspartate-semialdehyde dehydrogenase
MDLLDNLVPFIEGEEDKMASEPRKILGDVSERGEFLGVEMKVSATCTRVAVSDGHTLIVSIRFKDRTHLPSVDQVKQALQGYRCGITTPSMPQQEILVLEQDDRPQPRLDRMNGHGYTVSVGRIRTCDLFDIKLVALVHNTIMGAAGSAVLNAEIALVKGLF